MTDISASAPPRHLVHPPQQRRGHVRQQALIRAGLHLTETRDWDAITVGDIAAEIGCSTGTFYTRFHSKEAYFDVLLEHMVASMLDRNEAFYTDPRRRVESTSEFISHWVRLGVGSFQRHRGLYATGTLNVRRLSAEARASTPLLRLRARSRALLLSNWQRHHPGWDQPEAQGRLLFMHQMVQGVLLNAVLTQPGPLQLDDPRFTHELTLAACAYLGLQPSI